MNTSANPMTAFILMTESRRKWMAYKFQGGKMTYRAWKATMELHKC